MVKCYEGKVNSVPRMTTEGGGEKLIYIGFKKELISLR